MGQSKSKKAMPDYEAPLRQKIQLLYNIRDFATEIVSATTEVIDAFNVPGPEPKRTHNVAIGLASYLSVHGTICSPFFEEYGKFLFLMRAGYDKISREQAIFHQKVIDKVIEPFEKWLTVDYKHMHEQILELRERAKRQHIAASKIAKKKSIERMIAYELTNREFQLQLGIVKVQLGKLEKIREAHNSYLRQLIEAMDDYNDRISKILEQHAK
ncbi:hypothetical protein GPALN_011711 [Globodera pallida]|nr:hypothetical protein GPALN_011711 [Globodera pallida]